MKLKEPQEEEIGFQMSPMIDIVFQLIIFFMVVSTFHKLETVEGIKLPVASYSKEREPIPGNITINIKENGVFILNQREYSSEQLEKAIVTAVKNNPGIEFSATIRADARTPHKEVTKVLKLCSNVGIYKISFSALQSQ